jgi:hypothetical protein
MGGALIMRIRTCMCGSGRSRYALHDARGIFLTYVCSSCREERTKQFRAEVLWDPTYDADEPIDGDGDDGSLEEANNAR